MPQRVQSLRSSVKNQRPTAGTRETGEIYVNFLDLQLGVINASKNPQDLVAVRFFSTATDYATGDYVFQAGRVYRAKVAVTAGPFTAAQWDAGVNLSELPASEPPIAAGNATQYWRGDKSWQTLDKTAVGLGNVDNTADANKPVSSAQATADALRVLKAGDTMSGHLTLPTGPANANAVRKDYVDSLAATKLDSATAATTYAPLASPTFTGDPKAPTPATADNDTSIATTAHVQANMSLKANVSHTHAESDVTNLVADLAAKAPIASPTFTGDPQAPTPASTDNDTSIATTAFVKTALAAVPGATAQTRNRIVNPAFQISQENGNTALTGAAFAADQWVTNLVSSGTFTSQRVQVVTPNGSRNRYRVTVTVADAALAAGDYLHISQAIEGIRVADFGWGAAGARQVVLRIGFKGPAGTYSAAITNGAANRSYVANFTIAAGQANTDTVQTFVIPGDVTGTWATDNTQGMTLYVALAAGTPGVLGWQAAPYISTAANSNGMATAGNTFEVFDVGLYLDPQNTGIAPPWQMPDEAEELQASERYWQKYQIVVDVPTASYTTTYTTSMRSAPAITGGGTGFATSNITTNSAILNQTARAVQNIVLNARM